jgi:hypothetical protein
VKGRERERDWLRKTEAEGGEKSSRKEEKGKRKRKRPKTKQKKKKKKRKDTPR